MALMKKFQQPLMALQLLRVTEIFNGTVVNSVNGQSAEKKALMVGSTAKMAIMAPGGRKKLC